LQAHIDMCGKKADKNFHFSLWIFHENFFLNSLCVIKKIW
jgi:hypothetical protein